MKGRGAIGVFDSGIGGLTVVAALERSLPEERILYLGDTARLPYGTKSRDTVTRYSQRVVDYLIEQEVKGVVVACNSASALALDRLESPVPLWGVVEPGAAAAARTNRGGVIGVLATESTVRSQAYRRALLAHRPEAEVLSIACGLFAPLVEEGWTEGEVTEAVVQRYLRPLVESKAETVVLGCTHYPLLRPVLERVLGPEVTLVDSAESVAAEVTLALRRSKGKAPGAPRAKAGDSRLEIRVTDDSERFSKMARRILGREVPLRWVDL